MSTLKRREFLKKSALTAGFATSAPAIRKIYDSPNERINVAVVGFHGRGRSHYREFSKIPNVRVQALCDVDERLFAKGVKDVEEASGFKPKTEPDFRRLLEDQDIDAVSIATPDHWHALMTVWACQAGKDVYVEKPISYNIQEGRKMVQAARKYDRIVQVGTGGRSRSTNRAAIAYLHEGKLGKAYRAKAFILKGRASIGRVPDSEIPKGVNWDLFLGPAPYRPFNLNRFHYGWHFFWDTSTTDVGNSGVHEIDLARWGLNKNTHPVKVHCTGGLYAWTDSDQETPNVQLATVEYADGTILDIELSNLYTNPIDGVRSTGAVFYATEGYLSSENGFQAVFGKFTPRGEDYEDGIYEGATNASFPKREYKEGPKIRDLTSEEGEVSHFHNFTDCMRSRRWQDLHADILEGHLSTSICHLANVSYRVGRSLQFDPEKEEFVNDKEANSYLSRKYRKPYVMPDKV